MFRISKLTDYATVVLTVLAQHPDSVLSASALASSARLELPTVSKLLKSLAQAKLVASSRGVSGGYRLARSADRINVAEIIAAIEGPIGVTECSVHVGMCNHEAHCAVRNNWRRVSAEVERVLRDIRLDAMVPSQRPRIPSQLAAT